MNEPGTITLSFGMESSASLWNLVFEGFDQEVVLVSRFRGSDDLTIDTLYKFGAMICHKYKDCRVRATRSGIEIEKPLPDNNSELVNEWTGLMENIREEILKLVPASP